MMVEKKQINFPRYEHYKDSGIDWIGEIPAHWGIKKLKYLVVEHSGSGFPVELQGNKNGDLPFLKVSDISASPKIVLESENYVSLVMAKDKKWNVIPKGSLVTAKIGEALRKNHRKILGIDAVVDNNCIGIESININPMFNFYLHLVIDFEWFVNPGAVPSISVSKYKNFFVSVPPLPEQTAIAQFLDHKTAQIDRAIAIKEAQIKLLNERKQIMIQEAVTKGLDPSVPMKDSGIEWIGEIPAHWEVKPLKYICDFRNHKRLPLSSIDREKMQGEYPYYGASGIIDYIDRFIFDEKLILIAEDGANLLSRSTPLAFIADGKYWVNNHAHIIKPIKGNFNYWISLLNCIDFTIYISGAAQPKLTQDNLSNILLIEPPEDEIKELSAYIKELAKPILDSINIINLQIQTLKEYKTTLINEAVTGKIKVY